MSGSFVDEARVQVRGGRGGDGAASFLREKYRPRGGPDGGDGGRGGDVVLIASPAVGSLSAFASTRRHAAGDGDPGGRRDRHGADGRDLELPVPVGTVVIEQPSGEVLADLARPGLRFVVAAGGAGGRGNAGLSSGSERAPNYAERGDAGEERTVRLELRLVADVGLIGPPNAGKSTLLGAISRARPKVGSYPFTTLDPNLGVVEADGRTVTVADLPGLILGASEGKGLGLRFLKHAERCSVLALVIDLAAPDPVDDLRVVLDEVHTHSEDLAGRVGLVIANKADLQPASDAVEVWATEHDLACVTVSATQAANVDVLVGRLASLVERAEAARGRAESFAVFRPVRSDPITVVPEGQGYRVTSDRVERLVERMPLTSRSAVRRLQRRLKAMGLERALAEAGASEGDDVHVGAETFTYLPDDDA